LPDWLAQSAHYTLRCRQQACERISAGDSLEQAAPHCQDPARLPDPSTVRRWVRRRLFSVCWWVKTGATSEHVLRAPTILAWDLSALCRNLPLAHVCAFLRLSVRTRLKTQDRLSVFEIL